MQAHKMAENKRETLIPRGERKKQKAAAEKSKPKSKPVEEREDADKS